LRRAAATEAVPAKGFATMAKKKKAKKVEFVLDCSVTVAWFFEDEADAYAEAVEDSLATAQAVVPVLWPLEVANALVVGERRKRTTAARVTAFLTLLKSLPVTVDDETVARAWQECLHLARSHNLSAYDAAYLELALRRGLPLASLDDRLKAAAQAVGVPEYKP
jgi:predicted nucleic acid-binding protein